MFQQQPEGISTRTDNPALNPDDGCLDLQQLQSLLDGYCSVSGLMIGLMLDPEQGYVVRAGQCAVRAGFHDQVEGLAGKRQSRIREALEDWGEAAEARILTCPAGLADAVMPVQLPDDRTAWLVVGGVYLEKPDLRKKRAYARYRGFDPTEYLAAVSATRVVAESDLRVQLQFLANLVVSQAKPAGDSRPCGQDESKYQEIFELVNDAVYLMEGLDFVLVNRKAEELFGVGAGGLLGLNPMDFSPEYQPSGELSANAAEELVRKAYDGEPQRFNWRHRKADGTEFDAEISLTAIRIDNKRYVLAVGRDISQYKQLLDEVEHSRDLYKELYSTAVVGLFRSRISDGRFIRINEVAAKILGYDNPEEILTAGIKTTDYYSEEQRRQLIEQLQETGRIQEYNVRFHFADGSAKDLAVTIQAYPDLDYLEGVVVDITERKRIEDELQRYREELEELVAERTQQIGQFQRFVENSNQGMGWVDLEGKVQYVNRRLCEMLNAAEPDELLGKPVIDFYDETTQEKLVREVFPAVMEKGHAQTDMGLVSGDGEVTQSSNSLYLLRDQHGKPQYIANVVTDLTERIKAEQRVRELNTKLSNANESLSAMNEELHATNQEIQATNEELIATNEELDSAQRELETLNEELEQRVEERTAELRQSQELFKLATTAANVGLWDFNPQTGEIYQFNETWFTMLGYRPDEMPHVFETWRNMVHPDDLESVSSQIRRYVEHEQPEFTPVFRMRAKDGSYRWIMARGEVIECDAEGLATRMTGTHVDITDLKAVEEELNSTQLELKNSYLEMVQIFDTASSGMRVIDLNGEIKYANRTLAEICGRNIIDLDSDENLQLPSDCLDKLKDIDLTSLDPGVQEVREITIHRPDGEERICETRAVPYLDYQGNVVGVLEDFRDITDRRQAEEQRKRYIDLLESLERIDRLMHQHDDPEALLYSLLRAIHEIFGGDRTWLAYPCDPSAPALQMPYEILEEGYTSLSGKHELPIDLDVRKSLERILDSPDPVFVDWLEDPVLDPETTEQSQVKSLLCYPLFPRIGKPWLFGIHHCKAVREYSAHEKRLFKEISSRVTDAVSNMLYYRNLTASEKRFKSLVANLPGTIYRHEIVDGRYEQVFVSENIIDLTGYPARDFMGDGKRSVSDTIHPEDQKMVKRVMREALEAGRPYQVEYRVVDRWGKVHWVHESGRKYIDEHEEREFIDGEVFDITDRKEWVNKLEELNRELEKANRDLFTKNEEMTAINEELLSTNEALAHSQKELKESQSQLIQSEKLAAIGELASGVAHELNQPLNHISITAQLLERMLSKEGVSEEEIIYELGVIRGSVNRAVSIIRNMRDFSRQDQAACSSPVDVRLAVANALSMFGAQLRTHNIDLRVDQPDWPVMIMGLENNLVQVVINLVTNARDALDASPDNRKKIINVKIEADETDAKLSIEDNGTGIPADILPNVFNPFFTTKEPGAGTGLGLSITHRIVENLGGRISAQSEEGRGTSIVVSIPRSKAADPGEDARGRADA